MRDAIRNWVGVDVHKDSWSVAALRGDGQRPILEERLGPSEGVLQGKLRRLGREGGVGIAPPFAVVGILESASLVIDVP